MAKRRREPDSDGTPTETADFNMVFVDTSLDTHLAMLVSSSDTVSDFKKKMALEHKQCFPNIGDILVHSMKVKRRSNFYHLPDIMLVWSAFHGVKGNWFLSADASGTHKCQPIKNSSELGNGVKMSLTNVDDNCRDLTSNVNRIQIPRTPLPDGTTEKNVATEIIDGFKAEKSVEKTTDQINNYSEETCFGTESRAKKKCRVRHRDDASPSLKDGGTVFHAYGKDASISQVGGSGNSWVDAVKDSAGGLIPHEQHGKPTMSETTAEVSGVRNDQFDVEDRLVFEGTSLPTAAGKSNLWRIMNCQNLLGSNERKEDNALESKMDYELHQDILTKHSGCVSVEVPDLCAGLGDASGGAGDVNTDGNKWKKKKFQKTASKAQDTTDMEESGKGESMKPSAETNKSDKEEQRTSFSLQHNQEIIIPSDSKALDHVDPDLELKDASSLWDIDAVIEPEISSGIKKKKKKKDKNNNEAKKSVDTNNEKSGIEQIDSGLGGSCGFDFPSTYHIPEETRHKESNMHHEGKDVQMKLLENYTPDAGEKVQGVNSNEADFVILTQTEQTLEDVGSGNKETDYKVQNSAGNCAVLHASGKDTSITASIGCRNSTVDPAKDGSGGFLEQHGKPKSDTTSKVSGVRNDQFRVEDRLVFDGTSASGAAEKNGLGSILNSQNLLGFDERKEDNASESVTHYELEQDVPTEHSGAVSVEVPDLFAGLMDASGGAHDVNTDGNKRKKRRATRTAKKAQDTTDMGQIGKDEHMKPFTGNHKSGKKEEEKRLSQEHDHEVIMPSNSKASDHVDPDLALKMASYLQDADAVMEPEISSGIKKKKKKKREKKSVETNLEKSGIEQTDNGISGSHDLLYSSTDHIPQGTGKEESIMHYKQKDVPMKLLDSSTLDAEEKVQGADAKEADFVMSTQTEQTLEDMGIGNKKTGKKTQSSAANCHAIFPAGETENPSVAVNQLHMDNKKTDNKNRHATKKRKKRKLAASDAQENLPVKDEKIGIETLAIEETPISFVNSKQEGRHAVSSQVLSRDCEEKLDEMHGFAVNTDDLAETCEGINFKQYFVPGQHQDKVDSSNKVKKATMSNQEMRPSEKVKEKDLPSLRVSTELQNRVKSFENKKTENKYRRNCSGRSKDDSAQNSDGGNMVPDSSRGSLGASGRTVKDSSSSEMREMTLEKSVNIVASSSHLNKKNRSLNKSSSEKSKSFPRKRGNERSQFGLNIINMMLMKTSQKKSLFTKSGAIFQDNSGASSGDENGTVHSGNSTLTPSDSSSTSGYSVGESDLSLDSTRNVVLITGSNDEKGRSTGQRNMSKLDNLSASKDMTMDMILRSSKRFMKAKLLASQNEDEQNETQPIEYVPDSQAV